MESFLDIDCRKSPNSRAVTGPQNSCGERKRAVDIYMRIFLEALGFLHTVHTAWRFFHGPGQTGRMIAIIIEVHFVHVGISGCILIAFSKCIDGMSIVVHI